MEDVSAQFLRELAAERAARAEKLVIVKRESEARGKEPFDIVRFRQLYRRFGDFDEEASEAERVSCEEDYYLNQPNMMTMAELAALYAKVEVYDGGILGATIPYQLKREKERAAARARETEAGPAPAPFATPRPAPAGYPPASPSLIDCRTRSEALFIHKRERCPNCGACYDDDITGLANSLKGKRVMLPDGLETYTPLGICAYCGQERVARTYRYPAKLEPPAGELGEGPSVALGVEALNAALAAGLAASREPATLDPFAHECARLDLFYAEIALAELAKLGRDVSRERQALAELAAIYQPIRDQRGQALADLRRATLYSFTGERYEAHTAWLESEGQSGQRLDLTGALVNATRDVRGLVQFRRAVFRDCFFIDQKLSYGFFEGATFENCRVFHTFLGRAHLDKATFRDCRLRTVSFAQTTQC